MFPGDAVIFTDQVKMLYQDLGIVTWGDQQVCQDQQLIISELLLMLLPVVMVGPSEV